MAAFKLDGVSIMNTGGSEMKHPSDTVAIDILLEPDSTMQEHAEANNARLRDPALIQYVSMFVPKASGDHFNPHVTTGVAARKYLDTMLAEPFEPFGFSFKGAAIYHLGQFGTAAKQLKAWD